jgi:hypothetical protein
MALGIKYSGTFYNINGQAVKVDILTEAYASSVYPLRVQTIKISQEWNNYHTAIMGRGCEIVLVNTNPDWNFFEELMICEEQEFLLRVTFVATVVFEGWVLTDVQEQQILPNAIVNIKAANYLGQLSEVKTCSCTETEAVWSLIDYIRSILTKTALLGDIHVNCSLYETSMTNSRLMTDLLLHKHLFFDGEDRDAKLTYMNLHDTLNMLLKSYNMYVYYWEQAWYVVRYQDVFEPDDEDSTVLTRNYVVYSMATGAIIDAYEIGQSILYAQEDFKYVDTSQTLQYGKGYKAINVNNIAHKAHNLVNEYFGDAESHYFYDPLPFDAIEKWYYGTGSWYDKGGAIDAAEDWAQYINPETISTSFFSGIGSKFLVKGNKDGEGSLHINFRRQLTQEELNVVLNDSTSPWEWDTDYVYGVYIGFRIVLMFWDPERGDYQHYYWNNEDLVWEVDDGFFWTTSPTMFWMGGGEGKWLTAYKYDKEGDYYYWEFDQTFPFTPDTCANHDIFKGETVWELRLLPCRFYFDYAGPGGPDGTNTIEIRSPLFRKIRVTASDSESEEDIVLTGEIDVNRFAELDIDLDIYDHTDHGAANTCWVNEAVLPAEEISGEAVPIYPIAWLDKRTSIESALRSIPLQNHFLEDIFQFYNKPRKRLVTSIRCDTAIQPFSFIRDLHIQRDGNTVNLLLLSYVWDLDSMVYEIEAEEYVTDEGHRLVDGEMITPIPEEEGSSGEESSDSSYPEMTSANFINTNLRHSAGYVTLNGGDISYYDSSLLTYRLEGFCMYGVPTGIHIDLNVAALPAVGNNTYGYMIINRNTTNGTALINYYSNIWNEEIYCFYLTAPDHVWKVTILAEILQYEIVDGYEFLTDYAYSCLIEGVDFIGE